MLQTKLVLKDGELAKLSEKRDRVEKNEEKIMVLE